ncbi:MAG: type II secretion system inner membrane protein GspF [Pseudomonadota bacterium]
MSAFDYTALDARGKTVKGVLEGDSPRQIRQQLRTRSLTPLTIDETRDQSATSRFSPGGGRRLSPTDLTLVTRQLATLVKSGQPIEKALLSVSKQTDKPRTKSLLVAIRGKVLEGQSLAQAFGAYPNVFPEIYRSTIASGEASGHLDTVLMRLADYAERRHEMSKKLFESLMYPVVVVVMSVLILSLLLVWVVPKIVGVFESNDAELPLLTQLIIGLSNAVQSGWWLIILLVIGAVFAWRWYLKDERRRYHYHRLILRTPLIGSLSRGRNAGAFARTLGILTGSSVPVLEAMRIACEVVTNLPMRYAIEEAAMRVKEGAGISESLEKSGQFPGMMLHLIGSGEDSGALDEMLISAADYQEMEVQAKTSAMMAISQPLVIVALGALVMLIMAGILMPIFDMNQLLTS